MPWCHTCDRFLNPPSVNPDGSCPHCGQFVAPGRAHEVSAYRGEVDPTDGTAVTTVDEESPGVPWHLKLILGALAVYLGYRFFEAAAWTFGKVFS